MADLLALVAFEGKLNCLGFERRTRQPEGCQDVDATAFLSVEEYDALTSEYKLLNL